MCSIQEIFQSKRIFGLQDLEITIGRGPFLGVTDKRVSRNHGTLKQVNSGVELKSVHVNPCFYARKAEPEKWLKLDENESTVLHVGDIFSLLPKQYIYQIVDGKEASENHETSMKTVEEVGDSNVESIKPSENAQAKSSQNLIFDAESENNDEDATMKKIHPSPAKTQCRTSSPSNIHMDGDKKLALSTGKKRKLPAWMTNRCTSNHNQSIKTPKKTPRKTRSTPKKSGAEEKPKMQQIEFESDSEEIRSSTNSSMIPQERKSTVPTANKLDNNNAADIVSDDVKGVADDTESQNTNKTPVSEDDSSKQQYDASNSQNTNAGNLARNQRTVPRTPCEYGSSCYRKNPHHFQECSHPGDADYVDPGGSENEDDADDKPECPYGTSCYRKNPQHKKQYKHTKRVAPKRVAKMRATRKKRDDESSSDDYDDSFINDDESDVDDGASEDEDSDWNPSQNSQPHAKTRKSPRSRKRKATNYKESDSDETTDDEDLDDLVSNAKEFATNRKMWEK